MDQRHPALGVLNDPDHLDRLLSEAEAARFIRYSKRALQNWRVRGGGPRYIKVSPRSIRYRRRDLMAWIEARIQASTSDIRHLAPASHRPF